MLSLSLFSCELLNYLTFKLFYWSMAVIISNDSVNVDRDMQLLWRNMKD